MKRVRKYVAVTGLLVILTVVAGFVRSSDIYFLIKKNFTIFSEVYRTVSLNYVDEVDPEDLMHTGVDAMLESLDPYTVLLDEEKSKELEQITRGSYGGIGLEIGYRGNRVVVIAPIEGHSAYNNGIRAGDIILEVDGKSTATLTSEEVQAATAGNPGTTVQITVQRYGEEEPIKFELERERIDIHSVGFAGKTGESDDIGYVLFNRFSQNSAQEVEEALEELQKNGELSGLILDLRNNPGGLLEEAVNIIDLFVPAGLRVVETKGRAEEHNNYFETKAEALMADLPLIILQNKGSASAAEIIAGVMQDLDRAVVVGEQSFGKGLVQIVEPISYNKALKMTASRYYLPSGRSIELAAGSNAITSDSLDAVFHTENGRPVRGGKGIAPDVELAADSSSLLQASLMRQNHYFEFANRYVAQYDSLESSPDVELLYEEFLTYLDEQGFEYKSPPQQYLSKLDSAFAGEKGVDEHIKALEEKVESHKKNAFVKDKEEIINTLYLELVSRYKGQKRMAAASLSYDTFVSEAISVLQNSTSYEEMLTPEK